MLFYGITCESRTFKKISIPAVFSIFLFFNVSGQSYLTLNSGVNFSDIIGVKSETFHFRNGYFFGMRYNTLFSDPISFGTGLSLHINGIGNSYKVTNPISEITYVNNVDQVSLYFPFLLTYHSRRFTFDLGPHIRNIISLRQTETEITECRISDRERTMQTFTDRQEFYKLLVGMTSGLNIKVLRNIDFSLKYLQTFTPPGKDYNWQRQRIFQAGLTLNLGRNFTPRKLSSPRPAQSRDGGDYQTLSSSNIVRVQYRYMGEGNDIVLRFRTTDKVHYRLVEMLIGNSSGALRTSVFENSIRNVDFPFFSNMRFSFENPSTGSAISYNLNFEISRRGNWEVIIEY